VVSSGSTIYFQDNFEGWAVYGGAWSTVNGVNSSHTLDTSANYAEAGDKSLQLYGVDTANQYGAYLTENFSPTISGGINVRFFVFLPTGYESANSNDSRRLLRIWCGSNRGQLSVVGGRILMEEIGAWGSVETTTAISENAWHCLEMHINAPSTSTPMQFWIDGVSAGTLNGNFSGSTVFTSIDFGDVTLGSGSNSNSTFYLDELVVANSYIGTTIQSPTTYFSDTFENWTVYGGAWSTVNGINSSHTLNTSTTEAAAGTHSVELTGYDIAGGYGAYLTENFSPTISGNIYVRFYLFLPTGFEAANTGCGRRLLHVNCGSNRAQMSIMGGQPYMEQVGNWSALDWPSQLSENTWHCIEVHITPPAATTYFEFWVDGVLNSTAMTGNFSGSTVWNYIDLGDIALATGNNGNATFYMDEVIVSNSYIPLLP
jgi:head-tail adaptor